MTPTPAAAIPPTAARSRARRSTGSTQATAVDAEVRLYDNLFSDAQPDGRGQGLPRLPEPRLACRSSPAARSKSALVEEAKKYDAEGEGRTAHTAPGFQFMRVGYFCMDSRDCRADHLVFNRSVLLKDSFKPGK